MSSTPVDSPFSQRKHISLSRRVFNEREFQTCYVPKQSAHKPRPVWQKLGKRARKSCAGLTCKGLLYSWFPITSWLPNYKIRDYLVPDIAGGFTVSVLHIPQGLAYAMLASLPPISGLYLAVIPLLVYAILGTSRHLSLGTFAVVCLMIGAVVEREVSSVDLVPTTSTSFLSTSVPTPVLNTTSLVHLIHKETSNGTNPSSEDILNARKMEIAVTLALMVGIIQFLMGLIRLGFVAVYLSDPLVSGFTTGAAILVLTSQIKHVFGIAVPRYSGAFASVKTYIYIFKNITDAVPGALVTGTICIVLIAVLKKIDEKTRKHIKFPIPADLIAVILGTGITYGAQTNIKYDVSVLGDIPKGFPPFSVPSFTLMTNMVSDAFVIAIVIFATNISLAKMFARKNNYNIDPNQELIAYGASNIIGCFFSCFPVSGSLSRSAVQETQSKTLLCNLVVVIVITLVLLFLAPVFYCLPKAVLAAIVIVALKGLLKQFIRLKQLWVICKPDAVVWICTWLAVVLLGIDTGLLIGIIVALLVVLIRSARPRCVILGHVPGTEIYRDIRRFHGAREIPGIKIFRFESAMFYANVEYFRSALIEKSGINPQEVNRNHVPYSRTANGPASTATEPASTANGPANDVRSRNSLSGSVSFQNNKKANSNPELGSNNEAVEPVVIIENANATIRDVEMSRPEVDTSDNDVINSPENIQAIVIDGSTFNFIDTQGVNTLIQLALEFERVDVKFYLASCRHGIRDMLDKAHFTRDVGIHHLFISVHDAVMHVLQPEDEILSVTSDGSVTIVSPSNLPCSVNSGSSSSDIGSDTHL